MHRLGRGGLADPQGLAIGRREVTWTSLGFSIAGDRGLIAEDQPARR